jgi:hypothetical protein
MEFEKLIQLPESRRDDQWERQFLDSVLGLKVEVQDNGQPVYGPDGWPYISVRTGQGEEPMVRLVSWLAGRGIGLVVNSHKMAPDYVFTYGMLWNFAETGRFIIPFEGTAPAGAADLSERPVQGPPTDAYLPPYVRSILKEFLKDQGMPTPRILVATSRDFKQTDLVWSLESMAAPNAMEQRTLAEALSWFLPLHYTVVFAPEQALKGWVEL